VRIDHLYSKWMVIEVSGVLGIKVLIVYTICLKFVINITKYLCLTDHPTIQRHAIWLLPGFV